MPRLQSQHRPDDHTLPAFEDLAPMLDELASIAARELHAPMKLDVTGWDDGDYTAHAIHNFGRYAGTDVSGREILAFDRDREAFVARYVETDERFGEPEVLVERVVGRRPDPV